MRLSQGFEEYSPRKPKADYGGIPNKPNKFSELQPKKVKVKSVPFGHHYEAPDPYANHIGGGMDEYAQNNTELEECRKCGRTFASDRISKHQKVCKVNAKPRKVHLFHKAPAQPKYQAKYADIKPKKQPNWRIQHEQLQNAMKYNRVMDRAEKRGIPLSSLPPPPPSQVDTSLVQCKYCGRRFGEQQAERHIPKCKNTINKPAPPPTRPQPSTSANANYGMSSNYGAKPSGNARSNQFSGVKKNSNYRQKFY